MLGFYTPDIADLAHRSYVQEANVWFPSVAQESGLTYQAIADWEQLEALTPAPGRVVLFLDNRPFDIEQQAAFEAYMKGGGAWIGFHVCAFTESASEWDWYFNDLLGSAAYEDNTWRPTAAELRVEATGHPVARGLGSVFTSAPNEWYAFHGDLRENPAIEILLSIDPASFPLGTEANETWYDGDYPVVWTNVNYRMLYINMGHNDMDYGGTNEALSSTFSSSAQNQMLLNGIRWLGGLTVSLTSHELPTRRRP